MKMLMATSKIIENSPYDSPKLILKVADPCPFILAEFMLPVT